MSTPLTRSTRRGSRPDVMRSTRRSRSAPADVMADLAAVYDETRQRISAVVSSLDDTALSRAAPATPGWTIRDLVAHLTGDLAALLANDLPLSFFSSFGDAAEVAKLNVWTERMVDER